ncbi:MAG: hypothetical protein MK213_08125, partial [Planctomycetes bacterium]|nr:hypothetical protein [Planctomycetota bacterium]
MKREQIVLLGALVILGLMGWGLSEGPASPRLRLGVRTIEVFEAGANHPVVDFSVTGNRDPFREPREVEPLPPLTLPLPPLGELESLLPPPVPDAGANEWSRHLLVVPAQLPGSIDDLIGMDEGDPQSVDSDPIDTLDGQSLVGEEDLARQWDQVRTDALTIRWGRLLGGERWDWESGKDSIHFQEVDPETGLDRFAPYVLAPDAYQSFAFADTLRNRMELGLRKLPVSAGAIPERLAFVAWLLEQGDREPIAFELAETLARSNIQLAEDDAKTWLSLGAVFERTFQFDEAFAVYASMVGLPGAPSPDLAIPSGRFARTSAAQVRLGGLLETLGLDQEAEARYRDAWQLADGDPASGHALGSLLHRTGRCDEAVDILKRAEGMYPSRSADGALQHQVSLGQALLGQGEFAEAQRVFAALQRSAGESKSAVMGRSGEAAAAYLAGDFEVALDLAR